MFQGSSGLFHPEMRIDVRHNNKWRLMSLGKSSISMGHGFHGYVTNSQRVVVSEIINGHFRIRLIGGTYLPYIRPIYIYKAYF